jgi:hypothetical protein
MYVCMYTHIYIYIICMYICVIFAYLRYAQLHGFLNVHFTGQSRKYHGIAHTVPCSCARRLVFGAALLLCLCVNTQKVCMRVLSKHLVNEQAASRGAVSATCVFARAHVNEYMREKRLPEVGVYALSSCGMDCNRVTAASTRLGLGRHVCARVLPSLCQAKRCPPHLRVPALLVQHAPHSVSESETTGGD